jgi:hypothetical protein
MLSNVIIYSLTIAEIEYSDLYDENSELFERAIAILKNRIENDNFDEFDDDERECLENTFSIINDGDD